jgi:hypothetical protein
MKSTRSLIFTVSVISLFMLTPAIAQKKMKPVAPPLGDGVTATPKLVAIDAPPVPPALTLNINELKFGSQGVNVESCMYVGISNTSATAQTITRLFTDDDKNYSIPSPAQKMLPISIQPHNEVKISVCFKPAKIGEYKSRLVVKTSQDSAVIPVSGKGIKPEDVGKLPKTDLTVTQVKKKKHSWDFKLQLATSAKITMQLFDELGAMKLAFLGGDFKNEGVYEFSFEGLDKEKQKLPPGKYYLRCVIEDIARGNQTTKFTKVVEIKE